MPRHRDKRESKSRSRSSQIQGEARLTRGKASPLRLMRQRKRIREGQRGKSRKEAKRESDVGGPRSKACHVS